MVTTGNAKLDAKSGWIVGSFFDKNEFGLRSTEDLEIKWGVHKANEERSEWVTGETRETISILIKGRFEIEFRDKKVELKNEGDFVMWGRDIDHKWKTLEDSVVLTVRWPSIKIY